MPLTAAPPRILVVEDDPTVSELVADLVLPDLMIPSLDGFELAGACGPPPPCR